MVTSNIKLNASARSATPDGPVSLWLRQLETGDDQAAQPLYDHFCVRLQELAQQRLPARVSRVYDHEDVSVSAFHSLFLGIRQQRYQLTDRTDLWRLLLVITERKISSRIRYESREKRDVRRLLDVWVFGTPPQQPDGCRHGIECLPGREPTPDFAVEAADTCDGLMAMLPDDTARKVALLKMENHTDEEVAAKLGCSRETIVRKLIVIRVIWRHSADLGCDDGQVSLCAEEQA